MSIALQLDRNAAETLQDQLFDQLRQLILTSALKPDTPVAATRMLAEQLGVSRITVTLAYERLISEGYFQARRGVGTFVSSAPPRDGRAGDPPPPPRARPTSQTTGTRREEATATADFIDFNPHRTDGVHFLSEKAWLRSIRGVIDHGRANVRRGPPAAGAMELREAIVNHLAVTRGVMTTPEQVVFVSGRRLAAALIAHVLVRRGDVAVVESPGTPDVVDLLQRRGAEIAPVAVDEHGLETDRLPCGQVSLAYVTPTRQDPLGGRLPAHRRERLVAWGRETGAFLVEDDCDSEIRYRGAPPRSLAADDVDGRVIYIGSFAKTLGSVLGLGFMVVPADLAPAIVAIKDMAEVGGWLEQMVVAELLTSGRYEKHVHRVRKAYLERRDVLIGDLTARFGELDLIGADVGSQFTWVLPPPFPSAAAACERARAAGVGLYPVTAPIAHPRRPTRFHDRAVILGYAGLARPQLQMGVDRIANCMSRRAG